MTDPKAIQATLKMYAPWLDAICRYIGKKGRPVTAIDIRAANLDGEINLPYLRFHPDALLFGVYSPHGDAIDEVLHFASERGMLEREVAAGIERYTLAVV